MLDFMAIVYMFWLSNKKNNFLLHTPIWGLVLVAQKKIEMVLLSTYNIYLVEKQEN